MQRFRRMARAAIVSALLPLSLPAEPLACPGGRILTENAGADAARICDSAARSVEQLRSCGLAVPAPVLIEVTPALEPHCLGLYHCGEGRLEILAPDAYAARRAEGEATAFDQISPAAFFDSVIRHELAHAALETMPCPFASCIVGQEYIAYTMQVRFLPEADRLAFEEAAMIEGPVHRDILNPMILMMAPDVFAQRAWAHLTQREDPCGFIGQIARGEVLLDYERP